MPLRALQILRNGGVIAYCLPSHTNGKTQPLELTVFSSFKDRILSAMLEIFDCDADRTKHFFDFPNILKGAFNGSFTHAPISAGFRNAGIWPVDPTKLLDCPKPDGLGREHKLMSVPEVFTLLEQKIITRRREIGIQAVVLHSGGLSTSMGLTLTSDEAMTLIQQEEKAKLASWTASQAKKAAMDARCAFQKAGKKAAREELAVESAKRRSLLYNEPFKAPRSIEMRRKVVSRRVAENRDAAAALATLRSEIF